VSFAIIAEFPLGTYRGRRGDGRVDPLPSPARLHAALLNAAAQGVRAKLDGKGLHPCLPDSAALAWVEAHPPDGLGLPASLVNQGSALAYRPEGFFGVREKRRVPASRSDSLGSVALGAPIAWVWDHDPPVDIALALGSLCADVSHLGAAESLVRLQTGDALATHRLDPQASLFGGEGVELDIPKPGRTTALESAYERAVGRVPALRSDRVGQAEAAVVTTVERSCLARARYVAISPPVPDAPWPTVVILPVDVALAPDRRVSWCVALHRALVSLIGDGAPALVTGRYEAGVKRPPNRLAIQYVLSAIPAAPWRGSGGMFALLVPAVAEPADLVMLERAIRSLDQIRLGARGVIRLTEPPTIIDGDAFWAPVAEGESRIWVTDPAAVPDSRPVRGRPWTIGDAALLSVGLVLRRRFGVGRTRAEWYGSLVDAVRASGADVLEAHKLNSAEGTRYVHHVAPETAVQPYRAAIRLGRLAGERTILAIGQSRHLGGGLLTPLDLPTEVLADRARGSRP
jgi:CRISPR-associated protein Csb2